MSVFIKFLPQHGRWFEKVFGQMWEGLIQPVRLRQWWLQECCSFIRNRYRTSPCREPCFLTGRPFQSRSMEICGVRGGWKFLVTGGRRRIRAGMLGLVCIRIFYDLYYSIHHNCPRRCRHCLWSQKFHVDQNCSTWKFALSCGSKLLHMRINITPHDKIACHVEQFGSIHIQNCSTWQIYDVCCLFVIYAVLAQYRFCRNLRTFVWRKY